MSWGYGKENGELFMIIFFSSLENKHFKIGLHCSESSWLSLEFYAKRKSVREDSGIEYPFFILKQVLLIGTKIVRSPSMADVSHLSI